jgi:ribosomal protein S18 acetylase RimI-like enzyme
MIRDAIDSDLPCLAASMVRLQQLHAIAFPEIYRQFDAADALSHLSAVLSRADAMVRVAVDDGSVVGHAVLVVETKPESMFTHPQRYGHITQIEVEPEFRRRGIGRLLLADCEQLARSQNLSRIVLDVWAFNHSAKAFFQALGYDDIGSKLVRTI